MPTPTFDRFDICEAYDVFSAHYSVGGYTTGRRESYRGATSSDIHARLHRMGYRARPSLDGRYTSLSPNAKAIYRRLVRRVLKQEAARKRAAA